MYANRCPLMLTRDPLALLSSLGQMVSGFRLATVKQLRLKIAVVP